MPPNSPLRDPASRDYLKRQQQQSDALMQQSQQNAEDDAQRANEAQRQQERQARETERQQEQQQKETLRAQNVQTETQLQAQDRPQFTDAAGVIRPQKDDATFAAEQATKNQAKADALRFKQEGRKYAANPIDGSTIPLQSDAAVEAARQAKAEAARRSVIDRNLQALRTEADDPALASAALTEAARVRAEKALTKKRDEARYALQAKLGQQATAKTGAADWVPFNENPTPEAQAAAERLKRLEDPNADLEDDDLALLDADPTTASTAAAVRNLKTRLAQADEAGQKITRAKTRIWEEEMRRDNPAKYRELQRQKLLSDPNAIEGAAQDFEARKAALETNAAEIATQRDQTRQQIADIEALNTQRMAEGVPAADLIQMAGPDGQPQPWSKELAAQRATLEAQAQAWEGEQEPRLLELQAEEEDLKATAALINEAQQGRQQQAESQRQQTFASLAQQPGGKTLVANLTALDAERAQRMADLQKLPEGSPERQAAEATLQGDLAAKAQQVQEAHAAERGAAAKFYAYLKEFDPQTDWTKPDRSLDQVLRNASAKSGIDPETAKQYLPSLAERDWTAGDTKATSRVTSDGQLLINPTLASDAEAYKKAVESAKATPEAKQAALAQLPAAEKELAAAALPILAVQEDNPLFARSAAGFVKALENPTAAARLLQGSLTGMADSLPSFNQFVEIISEKQPDFAGKSPADQAAAYLRMTKGRGVLSKYQDQILSGLINGTAAIPQQIAGAVAALTGNESAANVAATLSQNAQIDQQRLALTGANDAPGAQLAGSLASTVPSLAVAFAGGMVGQTLGRVGVALRAASKGDDIVATLSKGSAALYQQAAGVAGSSVAGGLQSLGGFYADAYQTFRERGQDHLTAHQNAAAPAMLAGMGTALLTLAGGATGVEKVFAAKGGADAVKAAVRTRWQAIMGGIVKEAGSEGLEEGFDQLWQGFLDQAAVNPSKTVKEIFAEALEAGAIGGILGGAIGGIQAAGEAAPVTPPPLPNPANLPETVAAAEEAIDGLDLPALDPQTLARTQEAARSVLYIAQGSPLTDLPADSLAALDIVEDPKKPGQFINGTIVAGKDGGTKLVTYTGGQVSDPATGALRPVRVRMENGQPIISQTTLDKLETILPAVRAAIPLNETDRRNQVRNPTAANQPPQDAAETSVQSSTGSGPQTPPSNQTASPAATAASQSPAPDPVEGQTSNVLPPEAEERANQLSLHLAELGLPPAQAETVARAMVAKRGVVGTDYTEQAVSKDFMADLKALGISGSLSSVKAKENPLKAGPDLAQRLASYSPTKNQEPTTKNSSPSPSQSAPVETQPALPPESKAGTASDSSITAQGAATPAKGGVDIPQGEAKAVPADASPAGIDFDAYLTARQAAMKAIPVAKRKDAVKLLGALDKALNRYGSAFSGVRFVTTPGGGLAVNRAGGKTYLDIDLGQWVSQHTNLVDKAGVVALTELEEEFIHRAASAVFTDADMSGFFRGLPADLQRMVYKGYHVADIASKAMPAEPPTEFEDGQAVQLGHEFLRMLVQDSTFNGRVSEAIAADPGLGEKIIAFLQKLVSNLRKLIDKADTDTRVTIAEYEKRVTNEVNRLKKLLPDPLKAKETPTNLADTQDNRASVISTAQPSSTTAQPSLNPVLGTVYTAYTDSNDAIEVQWAVVDVNSLVLSNEDDGRINPAYPQELQPRDRTSAGSEAQVADIAKNFNLDRLSASNGVGDGAPIIGADGVVESGNGRGMGARRAYATGKPSAKAYRETLLTRAPEFGLNAEQVEAVQNPVLVRIRRTDVNRPAFVLAANVSTIAPKRDIEQAKIDAGQIVPDLFESYVPSEDGDIFTAANADFIKGYISTVIPPAERPAVIDARGNLSQSGLRRIRNALFVHAYGKSPEALNALARLTESVDAADTNIARALIAMAPRFGEQNARIAAGALQPLSITEELTAALQILSDLKNRGEKVSDWLAQDRIPGIGEDPGPVGTALVEYLHENRQRPRQIIDTLARYASAVDAAGDPRQMSMFDDEKPTKATLWARAAESTQPALAKSAVAPAPESPEESAALDAMFAAAAAAKPQLDEITREIAAKFGATPVIPPKLKGRARSLDKMRADYAGDATKLKDLARSTIEARSLPQAKAIAAEVSRRFGIAPKRNLFEENPVDGYRDALFNLVIDGHTVEMQVHVPEVLQTKEYLHQAYVVRTGVERKAKEANRAPTDAEWMKIDRMNRIMRTAYNKALGLDPDLGATPAELARRADQAGSAGTNSSASSDLTRNPPLALTSSSEMGRGGSSSNAQPLPSASRTTANASARNLSSGTSMNPEAPGNVDGLVTGEDTRISPENQEIAITTSNINAYAGNVDVSTLRGRQKDWKDAFDWTPGVPVVPLSKLVSPKNELADRKFLGGLKKDPRQTAADWIVKAMNGTDGAKKRAPLDVTANPDGTYTIQDGNATAQALMLADWKAVPVNVVQQATLAKSKVRPDAGPDLFSFNTGMGLDALLTPAQKEAKVEQAQTLDLFGDGQTSPPASDDTRRTKTTPRKPARVRTEGTAPKPVLGDLFNVLAGQRKAERNSGMAGQTEGDLFAAPRQQGVESGAGRGDAPRGGSGSPEGNLPDVGQPADAGAGNRPGRGDGQGTPGGVDRPRKKSTAPRTPAVKDRPAKGSPGRNISFTRDAELSPRGLRSKLKANLEALRIVKTVETEGRQATVEEKQSLIKFSGWGALSQAFDDDKAARVEKGEIETRRDTAARNRNDAQRYSSSSSYYLGQAEMQEEEAQKLENWKKQWNEAYLQIRDTLTDQEYRAAKRSTINAHFTSPEYIGAMWDIAEWLGFKGGNVLEPGAGIGHFFGIMPENLADRSNLFGVELDSYTAKILAILYPEADIQNTGFQTADIADNSIDLGISNVPFANVPVVDKALEAMGGPVENLHDYFFGKALTKLKPGGVQIFITSAFTMDKGNPQIRQWLAERADLVAAFRLPNDAFKENAGTDVVTDIIVLRKKDGKPFAHAKDWTSLGDTVTQKGEPIRVNQYFATHPQNILGLLDNDGSMFAGREGDKKEMTVHSDPNRPPQVILQQAIATLPRDIFGSDSTQSQARTGLAAIKMGNVVSQDGKFYFQGQETPDADLNDPKNAARVKAFISARDALNTQYDLELSEDATPEQVEANRFRLNQAYDSFVTRFENFHHSKNKSLLLDDPDYFRLLGAEVESNRAKGAAASILELVKRAASKRTYVKADIFRTRVLEPRSEPTRADSLEDAFGIALGWRGRVDVGFIASLTDQTPEQVERALIEREIAVRDPETGQILSREQYLAGNVRRKLQIAQASGPDYRRNVQLLEPVQPQKVGIQDIRFKIGATWIPGEVYSAFLRSLGLSGVNLTYITAKNGEGTDRWEINDKNARWSGVAYKDFQTSDMDVLALMDSLLNLNKIAIYTKDKSGKRDLNTAATSQAKETAKKLNSKFIEWARSNAQTGEQLAEIYNQEVNAHAKRTYDGQFLTFPWANKDFDIFPDKKNTIWRAIQDGFGLIAHGVGGGKTIIGSAIALEMRRLGMARKPMIVVHNSTLEGFAKELAQMAPAARVLVGRKDELQGAKRKEFLMRMAAGDWDAIVIAHSTFSMIADDPIVEIETRQNVVDEMMESLKDSGYDSLLDAKEDRQKTPTVKNLIKQIERMEAAIEKASKRKVDEGLLNFQQLGIDALIVDEIHEFKKMPFSTKQDAKGVDGTFSEKGYALMMRARQIQSKMGGKNIFTMTGTPVTNTLGEIWNMVRLVAPHLLAEYKIEHFDQFVSKFAEVETVSEMGPTGDFKLVDRLSKVVNLPEWATFLRMAADVKLGDSLVVKNRPGIKGGKPELVAVPRSAGVSKWVDYIRDVLAEFSELKGKDIAENPKLTAIPVQAYMASRAAAIDIRLIEPRAKDEPDSKVNVMLDRLMGIYERTSAYQGTQVIFADSFNQQKISLFDNLVPSNALGIELDPTKEPGTTFNLYEDIRAKLIARGVPASEIAVITDSKWDDAKRKQALFEMVNEGKVRIIIGSTQRLGTGVNMQRRMAAGHHLDVPWTPAGLEQRDGRVFRQGNIHGEMGVEIELIRYGMKDTLDAALWQKLETKQRFITLSLSGNIVGRELEEVDEIMTLAEQRAVLSGPYGQQIFELETRLKELDAARSGFTTEAEARANEIRGAETHLRVMNTQYARVEPSLAKMARLGGIIQSDGIQIAIDGQTFETKAETSKALDALFQSKRDTLELTADGFWKSPATNVSSITVNGIPVFLDSKIATTEQFDPETRQIEYIPKTSWELLSSPADATEDFTFGRVTSSGTLLARLEELAESVESIRSAQTANTARLRQLSQMSPAGAWPLQAEYDEILAKLSEIRAQKDATSDVTQVSESSDSPALAKSAVRPDTPTSYESAAPDPFTGIPSLITGPTVSRDQGRAIAQNHAQRLRAGLRGGEENRDAGPALAADRSRAFVVPVLSAAQMDRLQSLPPIGEGAEAKVYADRGNGVVYKVLQGYQESPALGIWPDLFSTADAKLDYVFSPATRPRQLAARIAVQTLLGGTPTEIVGIGPDGHVTLKQPLSSMPDIASRDAYIDAGVRTLAKQQAGLVLIPPGMLSDPTAPSTYLAVVEGRPYLVADLVPDNFVGDTQRNARLNDVVVTNLPATLIPRVKGLAAVVTQAGQEAARLGDRANRLFASAKRVDVPHQIRAIGNRVAQELVKRKSDRVADDTFEFQFEESDDPQFDGDGYYLSSWNAPTYEDEYLEGFIPLPSISLTEKGTFFVGEGSTEYPSLEKAQAKVKQGVRSYLNNNQGSFDANMDGQESARSIFDEANPFFRELGGLWDGSKWGSWYFYFEDAEGEELKVSIRDHQATRADLGLPDKVFEVSKDWEPTEVADALAKAYQWIKNAAPISEDGAVESSTKPESADAPTRAGDVRLTDSATEATSDSAQSLPPSTNSSTLAKSAVSPSPQVSQSPSPLARLGWNHLDRSVSAKLAALTRWTTDKTHVGELVAKWGAHPNAQPFIGLGKGLKRELFPDSVLPREIAARKREMEIKTALGAQRGMDLVRALSGKPKFSDLAYPAEFSQNPMHRRNLYLAMTGEIPMTSLPQALQDLGGRLRDMLVDMGREAVKQGRMSTDTFANLQSGYMPHYYKEDVQREKSILQRFRLGVRDILAQRTTAWHIVDNDTKDKTGEPRLISWQGNQWRFRNKEHRDAFYEDFILNETLSQVQARGGKAARALTLSDLRAPAKLDAELRGRIKEISLQLKMRYSKERPLDIDEQEKAGLIMDPVYAIARYTAQMVHDNSTAEFFNFVAGNKDWTSDTASPGFTEIPDNPRFGRLAGKYVTEDVSRQILEMVEAPNIALQLYDTLLGWWKSGKTVLNPGTHLRNVLGNVFFSQLAGTSVWNPGNVPYYKSALKAMRNGGPDLQEAYEMGVLGADFVSSELRQTLRQLLPDPATIADDGKPDVLLGIGKAIGRVVPDMLKNPLSKGYNQIAALYQAEDELFKLATYLKAKAMTGSAEEARDHVRQWFPYFDQGTSATLKTLGRTAMPFLGFYRESIRIFGNAVKERPIALATGLAVPSLITFMSAMLLGLDDDDLDQVKKDMRGKAGKLLGPTPFEGMPLFSMLLPVRSDTGQVQQFDISAIHPFVDFLGNRVEATSGQDWYQQMWRSMLAAGPIGSLVYSQMTGKDTFGDRTFVEENMTAMEKIGARADNLAKTLLPPLAPGGTGFKTLMSAGERTTNKTFEVRSPVQAVTRAVIGLDVRNATPDLYRMADDWRKANGLPTSEGMDFGGSTPVSRARKALFAQLAQDEPNPEAIKNIKTALTTMGSPIKTPQDVQRLLFYRNPLMIIGGDKSKGLTASDAQQRFRNSLKGLEREALDQALAEYEKIKAKAPALLLR